MHHLRGTSVTITIPRILALKDGSPRFARDDGGRGHRQKYSSPASDQRERGNPFCHASESWHPDIEFTGSPDQDSLDAASRKARLVRG